MDFSLAVEDIGSTQATQSILNSFVLLPQHCALLLTSLFFSRCYHISLCWGKISSLGFCCLALDWISRYLSTLLFLLSLVCSVISLLDTPCRHRTVFKTWALDFYYSSSIPPLRTFFFNVLASELTSLLISALSSSHLSESQSHISAAL